MRVRFILAASLALAGFITVNRVRADVVTDWNAHLEAAVYATAQPVPAQPRFAAIVHVAMFDAVNGIARKYTPYFVTEKAPPGARQDAAAVQAAYTTLKALYPSQAAALDAAWAESLARIPGNKKSRSIQRGLDWGEQVANQILALRSTDGWTAPQPPFFGGMGVGEWRSVPFGTNADGSLPAVFPQIAVLEPFVMDSPSHFRPGPPYGALIPNALATAQYAADLNEVKAVGRIDSVNRTPVQRDIALLWQAVGGVDENRIAREALLSGTGSLVDNARIFALINIAACDALIAGWDSKFAYNLWRPHHAIRLADTDGNSATEADPAWTALILAPRFPEYVSNHSTLTGAIMSILARELGDDYTFTLSTPLLPGVTQTFQRFSDAGAQVKEARIWGGIHFRHACDVGEAVGLAIAEYAVSNFLLPLEDDDE